MRARRVWAGLAGIPLALAGVGLAHADNIQNVIVNDAGTDKTITTAGKVTVVYTVDATGGDGCDASDGSPAMLSISAPTQVVASTNQLTFNSCDSPQSVTFTSQTPSSGPGYAIGHSVSDTRGNYSISSLNFNLKVVAASSPTDSTAPSVTPVVTGTEGLNGWYTSDVTVSWNVSDGESTVSSKSGCDTVAITQDQAATPYTCTATSAGGTTTESVSVKRDAAAPVVTPDDVNSQTWRNTPLSQAFAASDAMSGIPAADQSFTLTASAESANGTTPTTASRTVTDAAGNSTTRTVSALIDTTAPTDVTINGGPEEGGKYFPNNVPEATCSARDALSGLAADGCVVSGYSTAVGTHTLTATATDRAGNFTTVTGPTYTVRTLTLTGFYAPVDRGIHNTVKGGATVPLKFEVFDEGVEVTATSVVKSFTTKTVSCTTSTSEDAVEELAGQSSTGLRYDATGGQFIQNWQTPKKAGTCYEVRMTTIDDSSISALFKLK